jgi:hypothetical protein
MNRENIGRRKEERELDRSVAASIILSHCLQHQKKTYHEVLKNPFQGINEDSSSVHKI